MILVVLLTVAIRYNKFYIFMLFMYFSVGVHCIHWRKLSSATEQEINRLRKQVFSLCKEKQNLQSELKCLDREKEQAVRSFLIIAILDVIHSIDDFNI